MYPQLVTALALVSSSLVAYSQSGSQTHPRMGAASINSATGFLEIADDLVERAPDNALLLSMGWLNFQSPAPDSHVIARLIEVKARALSKQAQILAALDVCDSAQALYRSLRDSSAVARIEQLRGEVYMQAGDFINASEHLEVALTFFALVRDLKHMAAIHRSLGSLHYFQRQFPRAWEHYLASRDLWRAAGDDKGLSRTYRSMGVLAAEEPRSDALSVALSYSDSALRFSKRANDYSGMSSIHGNMGLMHMHLKDTLLARIHNDSALWIARDIGDSLLILSAMSNLGTLAVRTGNPALACANCAMMLEFAERHNMRALARDAVDCMTTGFIHQEKWHEAYLSQNRYYRLRDSTYDASSREVILRRSLEAEATRREYSDSMAFAAETGRLQNERTIEKLRADRNRNRAVGFGIGGLLLLGVGGLLYRSDRKRHQERFEREAAQLEMQALRAQMNPHFIFNALNSINNYVQANERDLASGFLTKFARLMRLVLEHSRHAEVPLSQDLEALRLYLDLERARMKDKFEYRIEVDAQIDQETTLVPPLVVQPFVENAIWHGISRKEGNGRIRLSVEQKDVRLVMNVEDDGVGRKAPSTPMDGSPAKTSLGASITRDRLAALGRQHGVAAGFRFIDLEQGTRVEVVMPLVQEA